jgi:phage terminase large subunit-like protein
MARKDDVLRLLEQQVKAKRENRLKSFHPYPKQRAFIEAGADHRERLLCAGNQLGKSTVGAYEMACHLTGIYPSDWPGRRFDHPVRAWAAGESSAATRDISQRALVGSPGDPEAWGTGMIPKALLVGKSASHGVADAIDTLRVRHASGGVSECTFKSYEMTREKWQGASLDLVWLDEEPDESIYIEALARTAATRGSIYLTFTPLRGYSAVVSRFLREASPDRCFVKFGIKDAGHIPEEERARVIASYPAHQRQARTEGEPLLGAGAVFETPEVNLYFPPDQYIPEYWHKLWGIDFGVSHPFAAVLIAYDRDGDCVYVLEALRMVGKQPIHHVAAMRKIAPEVKVAYPHDGHIREKSSGTQLIKFYKDQGLRVLGSHATWPGGNNSLEAGLMEIEERASSGRLRVKQTLHDWFEEYRMYHRDENGNPVKIMDDLLAATRYALMMKRHARPGAIGAPLRPYAAGEPLRRPYRGPQKSATEAFFDVFHRRGYP